MKRKSMSWVVLLALTFGHGLAQDVGVRLSAVAGRFYPIEPDILRTTVQAHLEAATAAPAAAPPLALVAPHAGYVFSGGIAGEAWASAEGHAYDAVVLLGTNHSAPGLDGASIWLDGGYETPLGVAPIDRDLAAELREFDPPFCFYPPAHLREHSIEVQVPFVQVLWPETPIVPVVVGSRDPELCARMGKALAAVTRERRVLVVASSDLSHYPAYRDAVEVDGRTIDALLTLDAARFRETLREQERAGFEGLGTCACGEGPLLVLLAYLEARGGARAELLRYANSGDMPAGDRQRVVGYAAVAFHPIADEPRTGSLLDDVQRQRLLAHARRSIEEALRGGALPEPGVVDEALRQRRGAFVTLKKDGALRGCIGHMAEDRSAVDVVARMARQAAFHDPRFPPLRAEELEAVEIEISLLTPMRPVERASEIVLGRDGVVLRKGGRSAVFLPQVAVEQGWSLEEMLGHLSRKAGLASDAWKEGARFLVFQAEVFREEGRP